MKKFLQGSVAVVLMAILFSACMKNDDPQPNIPAGGLMAFNLAADADFVGVRLDNNNLVNQPLQYTNFTGGYLPIYVGSRTAWAYNYQTGQALSPQTTFTSADSSYYSLFVVSADSSYRTVVVEDALDSLKYESGQAFVRYINAVGDSIQQPQVTVSAGSTAIVNEAAPYAHVSHFTKVAAGDITVAVKGTEGVDASRTLNLEANKIYTLLLIGKPGATGDKAVQIKFIANGTVEAEPGAQ